MSSFREVLTFVPRVRCNASSRSFRHVLRDEYRLLAFESLGYAVAPALGNGLGKAIRENLLFPFSTPSKKATAADSGEAFGQSMPRVISVSTGPVKNGMNRHALAG